MTIDGLLPSTIAIYACHLHSRAVRRGVFISTPLGQHASPFGIAARASTVPSLPHSDAMDPLSSYQPRHWYCQGPSHSRYISVALSNANVADGV